MDLNAYNAFRSGAAYVDLTGRGVIRVVGEDRARLLHAMCTNHVQNMVPGDGCYAFFLTAQGRIVADAHIYSMPDYFLLDTEPESRTKLMEHLDKFIIADDVVLRDFTDSTAVLALEGPRAGEILSALGALPGHKPCSLVEWGHVLLTHCSYAGGEGYTLFVPVEQKDNIVEQLISAGAVRGDIEAFDALRIANGQPRYGVEITETSIPQETQQMHAVHSNKGCYLGQEIVERVRSRGHVNRLLTQVQVNGPALAKGTKVQAGGKDVGEIVSSANVPGTDTSVAFGIIRAEALQPGAVLSAGGLEVRPAARQAQ
jgi:aminomethyltransferase